MVIGLVLCTRKEQIAWSRRGFGLNKVKTKLLFWMQTIDTSRRSEIFYRLAQTVNRLHPKVWANINQIDLGNLAHTQTRQ